MANGINTVQIKGFYASHAQAIAAGTITPGNLVEVINSSGVLKIQRHGTAAARTEKAFAVESHLVGKDLNFDYVANDTVQYIIALPGDEINALVPASASAIVIGDKLESNGDGTLVKHTSADSTDPSVVGLIAIAMEALDNSGGSAVARIRVRVI